MNRFLPPSVSRLFLTFFFLFFAFQNHAQTDSLTYSFQDAIESTVAANDDASFDYDTEFEQTAYFMLHPININTGTFAQFEQLRLLSPSQINDIITHRIKHGRYLALYELQVVLEVETIKKILPFITIDGTFDDLNLPFKDWFRKGKTDVISRWEHRLEKSRGYTEGAYRGDANRIYSRYRYHFNHRLSYGLTLEKDAGETLKPDFISLHFKLTDFHKTLKTIVLGDFTATFGQGLIQDNGFALGKSALVLSVEKNKIPIREYTSSNEANFLRGAAATVKISKNTEGVIFASRRRRDGNLTIDFGLKPDSTDDESAISALQFSGLHRTQNELSDKNAVIQTTFGGSLKRHFRKFDIGLNAIFNQFDKPILPKIQPYNLYYFRGKNLANASVDYRGRWQNIGYFGETAVSDNGGFATLNGALIGLDKRLSFSVLQRYFTRNYQVINAQPFAESSRTQDENGLYFGIQFRPNRTWTQEFYADFWRHSWLRFNVDAPSVGSEFFAKTNYSKRQMNGYLQFRIKTKQENQSPRPDNLKTDRVVDKTRTQLRLQINQKISKNIELRNRLELAFYKQKSELAPPTSRGFAAWQDVIFKTPQYPVSFSSRLAYFDTNDYNSAIYAFENDLLYNFSVLPYYFRGSRFYLNATYKFIKNGYVEARFARTTLTNKTSFGSGLDEIKGNHRTDFKVQLRFGF